jgi:Flp pilus assembly protein TadG
MSGSGREPLRRRDRHPTDRGAAAVEFALILPIVLLVIFAIIDFGRMLNAQITLTEAAREGARAAALVKPGGEAAGQARAQAAALSALGSITPVVTDCSDPTTVNAVTDITYTFTFVTPLGLLIGAGGTSTLKGHGVMPCLH